MGLLSLHDPDSGKKIVSLVKPILMDWVMQEVKGQPKEKEPIPEDVYEELVGPNDAPRLRFLIPFFSNRQNDRALLANGEEFPSVHDAQRYARRHSINIYTCFGGELY